MTHLFTSSLQKCSACTKNKPKVHGAPVQCTKGKCPKAFHVNCARDGHSMGIVFAVVRELEKEVIVLGSTPSTARNDTGFSEQVYTNAPGTDSQAGMSGASAPAVGLYPPQFHAPKIIKKLEVQILCTQHNPVCLFSAFRHPYGMLSVSLIIFSLVRLWLLRRKRAKTTKFEASFWHCLACRGSRSGSALAFSRFH